MTYSVWKYSTRTYDYYEANGPSGTHAGAPPAPMTKGDIGAVAEAAAWRLPIGARKVGSGEMPKGRIASVGGSPLDGVDFADPTTLLVVAGLGFLAWKVLR